MADARGVWGRMFAHVMVGLVLGASPGAKAAAPADRDLPAWLARNTDLPRSQIAFVNADNVYSLEPLGARLPTGEIVVLVRTEPLADDWGASHGFSSWDGNLLVDCPQRRLRVIRSATYPQRNRGGTPSPEVHDYKAMTPLGEEPAARLIAAACDADYAWPLRADPQRLAAAKMAPMAAPARGWMLQVARGDSEDGARRAATAARKTLAPGARTLASWTETAASAGGEAVVHTALLGGFSSYVEASDACETLRRARQDCLVRRNTAEAGAAPAAAEGLAVVAAARPAVTPAAAATQVSGPAPDAEAVHAVQVARGPSEDGARRALLRARKTLGLLAQPVRDAMPVSRVPGDHIRYEARLEGFATAEMAGEACRKLSAAGQDCFALQVSAGAPADAP